MLKPKARNKGQLIYRGR
ncbi:hypothetical protein IEO21_11024 [Rhodonia placenta]|uniref:Uncharacterized protein n=1 Tax=Rhodonia placenta TaxID=104341 RepID=A0A8H7NRL1_9APHY|nr:hypothetical protein IEO21_11024 [Postia placenta]